MSKFPNICFEPVTRTSVVTQTTTTTFHLPPIRFSDNDSQSSELGDFENSPDLDPKLYPLSHGPLPAPLQELRIQIGDMRARLGDPLQEQTMSTLQNVSSSRDRKREHSTFLKDGPPRKKRNKNKGPSTTSPSVQTHGLLSPSPQGPPSPQAEDFFQGSPSGLQHDGIKTAIDGRFSEDHDAMQQIVSSREFAAMMSLPKVLDGFHTLSPTFQSYFIYELLKKSPVPVLQTINGIIGPALRRNFLSDLPVELSVLILGYLDYQSLCRAALVCTNWNRLVDGEWRVWKARLIDDDLWIGNDREAQEIAAMNGGSKENLFLQRWKSGVWDQDKKEENPIPYVSPVSPLPTRESTPSLGKRSFYVHPFKKLYRRRFLHRRNWMEKEPKRTSFPCHANNVVTCLQFDEEKIITAFDDHSINIWDTKTGQSKGTLAGHEGGVWALQYIGNMLVSGSTDRTVRIWDLDQARCTHIFLGHTSTVRCLQIVEPENVNPDPYGEPIWEPAMPVIVTGSRDWTLRVWRMPSFGEEPELHPPVPSSPREDDMEGHPYHLVKLLGHRHAVRALSAHGRVVVSGSYDNEVRVWDIMTGECKKILKGHEGKVYSVVYDHARKQCASGSMDGTVRLWSTETGEMKAVLQGHVSLVGLLGLSYRALVSAAADSTLRIWDPQTGECKHVLAAHSGAITCFQHDEYKVISGSDGGLKMWNVRTGAFTRDLLTGLSGVWQISFNERFCVAAVQRNGQSEFEVLDFGDLDEFEKPVKPAEVAELSNLMEESPSVLTLRHSHNSRNLRDMASTTGIETPLEATNP